MKIAYQAIDQNGSTLSDVLEAPSIADAVELLRREGLFVTDAQQATGKEGIRRPANPAVPSQPGRMNMNELLLFTRQMAMLLRAGSPVVSALAALSKQAKDTSKAVIDKIRLDMEGGRGLSDSMKQFPRTFSDVYTTVVGAGEMSANLPDVFTRLGVLVGYQRRIRNRILSATAYPALLILLSSGIVSTIVLFVVPRFKALFESLGAGLPWSTDLLFSLSFFVRGHWIGFFVSALLPILAAVILCKTTRGRRMTCDVQTRLPLVGQLLARLLQAQLFRVMGLLLQNRVGLMDALNLVKRISANSDYQIMIKSMHESLEQGGRLGEALARSPLITPAIAQAVSTGEESGNLDEALLFVADVLDEENSQRIDIVTKLLEPVILILMGFVVGGIALSLFVPLFDLAAMAG